MIEREYEQAEAFLWAENRFRPCVCICVSAAAAAAEWFASFRCWVRSARDAYLSWHHTHRNMSFTEALPPLMAWKTSCYRVKFDFFSYF